jgi:hypothetical protein
MLLPSKNWSDRESYSPIVTATKTGKNLIKLSALKCDFPSAQGGVQLLNGVRSKAQVLLGWLHCSEASGELARQRKVLVFPGATSILWRTPASSNVA